ncbi:hypothetical protein FQN54_004929 [Arachnomyces sp. PD_36]|nr:hypothetical protein FQN54_004929 [Arachnomyces sp. PD_36]
MAPTNENQTPKNPKTGGEDPGTSKDPKDPPTTEGDTEQTQPVVPAGPELTVRIFKFFPGKEKSSPEAVCNLGNAATFKKQSLRELRKYLNSRKVFKSVDSALPFCTSDGARVEETTPFAEYANLVKTGGGTGTTQNEGDTGSTAAPGAPDGSGESGKLETCDVYLVAREKKNIQLSDPVKDFLDSALDVGFSQSGPLPSAVLKKLQSSYDHKLWAAEASKGPKTYAAEMSEDDWAIVMQNNDLTHGIRVKPARTPDKKLVLNGVDYSFLPAFTIKPRPVEFYKRPPGVQVDHTVEFTIPKFRIQDDSYVRMTEAKTDVESSFARSSLTQHDVQIAAGGNVFGYDIGAKFGLSMQDQDGFARASQETVDMMHISYNFPRVLLRLDETSLELDPVCRARLEQVKDFNSMSKFLTDYGQFFATQVQLGGRLHAAEDVKSSSTSTKEEKANAFKAAVSASFAGPSAQGSASYSHESKSASEGTEQKVSYNKSMSWEAQGGDTLLCNSPPDWCPTVDSFYTWRAIKRENLVFLPDLIGKLPGFEDVPKKFKTIADSQKPGVEPSKVVPYFVEFSLELEDSNGKEFALDTQAPGAESTVYAHWPSVKRQMGGDGKHLIEFGQFSITYKFGGDPKSVRRVTTRKATQAAKGFKIRTENVEGNKYARRGQQYQFDIPGESMTLSATTNLPPYVPQSYLFAAVSPSVPVKFAFWDAELAEDEQSETILDGSVVNLVAWIPGSTKPGFVCLRAEGADFDILPGSPDLDKIARFKIKYSKSYEAPQSVEEKRRVAQDAKRRAADESLLAEAERGRLGEEKRINEEKKRLAEQQKRFDEERKLFEAEKKRVEEQIKLTAEAKSREQEKYWAEKNKRLTEEKKRFDEERKLFEAEKKHVEEQTKLIEEAKRREQEKYWAEEKKRLDEEQRKLDEEKRRLAEEQKPVDDVNRRLLEIEQRRAEERWPVDTYANFYDEDWYAIQTLDPRMSAMSGWEKASGDYVSLSHYYDMRCLWGLREMTPGSHRYRIMSHGGKAIPSNVRSGVVKGLVSIQGAKLANMNLSWFVNKDPTAAAGNIYTIRSAAYPNSVLTHRDNELYLEPDGDGKWEVRKRRE